MSEIKQALDLLLEGDKNNRKKDALRLIINHASMDSMDLWKVWLGQDESLDNLKDNAI